MVLRFFTEGAAAFRYQDVHGYFFFFGAKPPFFSRICL